MDWIDLAEVAGTCECGDESSGSIKCGNFLTNCGTVSFSGRTVLHAVSFYKWIQQYSKRHYTVRQLCRLQNTVNMFAYLTLASPCIITQFK